MPPTEAARRDVDPLDADVGRILRLELDPVAVPLDVVVQVRGGEIRRGETDPRRSESDGRKSAEDCNSEDRGMQLPRTKYAHSSTSSLIRSCVFECVTLQCACSTDTGSPSPPSGIG